jgi:transposase-like protein
MAEATLNQPHYRDPIKAREYLESIRWPDGPVCPHCGVIGGHYALQGKAHRPGLWKCKDCRKQFSVTVGTVFERSKVGLHDWLKAVYLICSSKKGCSSHQLQRTLGCQYKTAWFMSHRIREAMKAPGGMFSTGGGTIEADETYVGGKERNKHRSKRNAQNIGGVGKTMVFSLVERGGKVRSATLPSVNAKTLAPYLKTQLQSTETTRLMTDGEGQYRLVAPMFKSHDAVNHGAGEYVRGDAHTNTVEGYFSILKRGIIGTFHHVSPHHLQRYVQEFDFRYNHRQTRVKVNGKWEKTGFNDIERTEAALRGIQGKRLTYRRVNGAA